MAHLRTRLAGLAVASTLALVAGACTAPTPPTTTTTTTLPPQDRPNAGFDVLPVAACWGWQSGCNPETGEAVAFTSTSTDSDGTIVASEWDFDGNLDYADARGVTVTHAFDAPGTYTVRLRVTDNNGATDTAAQSVTVTTSDIDNDGTPNRLDCNPFESSIHPGAVDRPDLAFTDSDCDGVDGTLWMAIFVATPADGGVDHPSRGTSRDQPLATIAFGLLRAHDTHRTDVYVAGGVYEESVTLPAGVSIYGGYRVSSSMPCPWPFYCEWWERPGTSTTILNRTATGGGVVAVNAVNIPASNPSKLQYLNVKTGSAPSSGLSSYGIKAVSSPGLTLEAVTVEAGNGAAGSTGSNGVNGAGGANGSSPTPLDCPATGALGGFGGASPFGLSGGNGGKGAQQPGDGNPGTTGQNGQNGFSVAGAGVAGSGGAGGVPLGRDGHDGSNGGAGAAGGSGSGGSGGALVGGFWSSTAGTAGTDGHPGGGGGGGGGSGQAAPVGFDGWPGDGGGGGGAGAAAGTAARGGGGGGGSFGVLIVGTTPTSPGPTIINSTISSGDGASGGLGGIGGPGGVGGTGGAGGSSCSTDSGGDGGHGGDGGRGGHGGGGAGGPSYAVYRLNSLVNVDSSTTLRHGAGGPGGPSLGNPGVTGLSGNSN